MDKEKLEKLVKPMLPNGYVVEKSELMGGFVMVTIANKSTGVKGVLPLSLGMIDRA